MTSLKFYALLAVVDLVGLFITIWVGVVPVSVGWVLIVLVAKARRIKALEEENRKLKEDLKVAYGKLYERV